MSRELHEVLADLRAMADKWDASGSRVICDPAPMDTDEDGCVLVDSGKWDEFENVMVLGRFDPDGSRIPEPMNTLPIDVRFHSYRREHVNLICTTSAVFHRRFMAATSVAKRLNLLVKTDRVALFRAVLYAERCAEKIEEELPEYVA